MEKNGKPQIWKLVRMLAFSMLCCVVMAGAAFALDGIVDTAVLNVRSETSVKSDILGKVYEGNKVDITGRLGNWYRINYKGEQAFVFVDYVTFEKNYRVDVGYGMVTTSNPASTVNVREEPSTNGKRITRLMNGTRVRVLGYTDGWYYIRFTSYCGYISADYLKLNGVVYTYIKDADPNALDPEILEDLPNTDRSASLTETIGNTQPPTPVTPPEEPPVVEPDPQIDPKPVVEPSIREQIVEYAKSFIGVKYVYGGSSPSTGFDCSGLTQYVFKHFGYSIDRSSAAQINNGTKITKDELLPGDLVFFSRSGYAVGHVGIYIGDGKFIHAPRTGDYVKITSLDENYYTTRYVGARRIVTD